MYVINDWTCVLFGFHFSKLENSFREEKIWHDLPNTMSPNGLSQDNYSTCKHSPSVDKCAFLVASVLCPWEIKTLKPVAFLKTIF